MKSEILGVVFGIIVFFLFQLFAPFPFGLVLGIFFAGFIIWYTLKHTIRSKDSLTNYRRIDPINEDERKQNDEALRILEKKYIEEKISKKEYIKRKKEFEEIEYNPRKCKKCGCQDFEFVEKERDKSESTSNGNYKCRNCGIVES